MRPTLVFYLPAIQREERRLRARYGSEFDEYAAAVPRFWPRVRAVASTRYPWSWRLYGRNRGYTAAIGVLVGLGFLWLKMRRGS